MKIRNVGPQLLLGNYAAGLFEWLDPNTSEFVRVSPPAGFVNYRITNSSQVVLFHEIDQRGD